MHTHARNETRDPQPNGARCGHQLGTRNRLAQGVAGISENVDPLVNHCTRRRRTLWPTDASLDEALPEQARLDSTGIVPYESNTSAWPGNLAVELIITYWSMRLQSARRRRRTCGNYLFRCFRGSWLNRSSVEFALACALELFRVMVSIAVANGTVGADQSCRCADRCFCCC